MPEKIEVEFVAKTDQAVKGAEKLKDKLEDVADAAEDAAQETKSLGEEVKESGAAMSLLDQVTGGLASKVRDITEVFTQFGGRIKDGIKSIQAMTAAQLKANLAFLANPFVIAASAVGALTLATAKWASSLTDNVVPVTTSFFNIIKSGGNYMQFLALQTQSMADALGQNQIARLEQAIAIGKAYGENMIDKEIEVAELRLRKLKEGEEGYIEAQTALGVLRATKAREQGAKEVEEYEKGRQAELQRILEKEAFEKDQKQTRDELDAFDEGEAITKAYYDGVIYAKDKIKVEPGFEFLDDSEEFTPEEQAELDRKVKLGQAIIKAEKEKDEKIKQARQDMFLNLASIFGAETRLGKAMLVAKQLQNARELAMDAGKTLGLLKGNAARSTGAIAEGTAQTAKVGFPQNIPLLIGYAAQAAGIISAIKQATSKEGIEVADSTTFIPASPQAPPQLVPSVSPVGASGISQLRETIEGQQRQPVRAYVVSTDVTTAQDLDRNIIEGASI